jgi:hypothetical protein
MSHVPLPKWLVEIHQKLWGRRDLVGQIFRKVNLNKTDFVALQSQLQILDPSRRSEFHIPMDVFVTKSKFLRSRSVIDDDVTAYFDKCDATSDGNLIPQPVVDTSEDITPPSCVTEDIEALDVDANATDDAMDIDAETDADIDADEAYLSEGVNAVFPCTIRYIDLTFLNLEHLHRVPHLMLIRDEWRTMVDIFNERERGIRGGATFSGQPGIGGYCDYS